MNIRTIVAQWLKENKYDGLYSPKGYCACVPPDLFPCKAEGIDSCEPGVRRKCDRSCESGHCDFHIVSKKRRGGSKTRKDIHNLAMNFAKIRGCGRCGM